MGCPPPPINCQTQKASARGQVGIEPAGTAPVTVSLLAFSCPSAPTCLAHPYTVLGALHRLQPSAAHRGVTVSSFLFAEWGERPNMALTLEGFLSCGRVGGR